ncbi:PREDICTED: uncharacterized mitochondrial protein AtMg00810-like [Brassica oleracea var. oleracea]|uniref:uncharacterized mitochondrial protein AtMg00810-like n=1 Tax=Brassica oleracea var. oleracea TaxID=109376 RepID=UPI0006A6B914|nr:PREDICTED: uncharacterized mitochondrial protein AtMg00810-like [Brassica oleracea var. oleracea]
MSMIYGFKKEISEIFEISDLGRLRYYLGIEVVQCEEGIMLSQERYAKKILCEAGMDDCNSVQAPMEFGLKLTTATEEQCIDATEYRRLIGCLRYLIHTRPDLAFSVGLLSRYMHEPKKSHGAALKQVLRYLKGYSDSGHCIDEDDGRSTTGHIFYLNECPILWCSQKQETVALSSCEADFMAATEAAK